MLYIAAHADPAAPHDASVSSQVALPLHRHARAQGPRVTGRRLPGGSVRWTRDATHGGVRQQCAGSLECALGASSAGGAMPPI
jgi:hypothetical protein